MGALGVWDKVSEGASGSWMSVSAVIPARNEGDRIGGVVREVLDLDMVKEVIVVDDASTDGTGEAAGEAGAIVIRNRSRAGYIDTIKRGIARSRGDIVVTLDGDGEHDPGDIPELVRPITEGAADLVFGRRDTVPRPSERVINRIVRKRADGVVDSGTGFRAMRGKLARRLELRGTCTCGILALEAKSMGARITEVGTRERRIDKPRDVAWNHLGQMFRVLCRMLRG